MKLNKNEKIIELVTRNINQFDSFENVYLFGSVLKKKQIPNDIDILLIFSKRTDKMLNDLKIIDTFFQELCGLPVDLTVLSCDEVKDTDFLTKINIYLKVK